MKWISEKNSKFQKFFIKLILVSLIWRHSAECKSIDRAMRVSWSGCPFGFDHLADESDCYVFYHCFESPWGTVMIPKTCGPHLMFNPEDQVCDWPSRVKRLRPECRGEGEPVVYHHLTRIGPTPSKSHTEFSQSSNAVDNGASLSKSSSSKSDLLKSTLSNLPAKISVSGESKKFTPSFDLKGLTSFLAGISSTPTSEVIKITKQTPVKQDLEPIQVSQVTKSDLKPPPQNLSLFSEIVEPLRTVDNIKNDVITNFGAQNTSLSQISRDTAQVQPTRAWRKTIETEDKRGKTVLPLVNGRFSLETLSVYTGKNRTSLKPEKYSPNSNSKLIHINIL